MRPSNRLVIAILTMITLAGSAIPTASAAAEELPNILPVGTPTEPILATSLSGALSWGNGILKIEVQKSEGFFDLTATKLGTFDVLFLEATVIGNSCTGLDDVVEGSMLLKGTFHIIDYKETDPTTGKLTLLTGLTLLFRPVHFECPAVAALVVWRGCLAGALAPENVLTKVLTAKFAKNGTLNDNLIITILNGTKEEACQLLGSENGGGFKLLNIVMTQTLTGFHKDPSLTAIEVLVMRL